MEQEKARESREIRERADREADERERQRREEQLRQERQRGYPPDHIVDAGKPTPACWRPDAGKKGYVAPPPPRRYDWAADEARKQRQRQASGKAAEEIFFDLIDPSGSPAGLS
jgi:hypothetical protein